MSCRAALEYLGELTPKLGMHAVPAISHVEKGFIQARKMLVGKIWQPFLSVPLILPPHK